ncbi:MAG: hypothetical protein IPM07_13700 [Anaerolineales bacterium]|nr:hypothetical protein [Anaerolineales bacterium]
MVKDFRTLSASMADYPPLLFVYMGSVEEGEAFFASAWPEARAVSDPAKQLYAAFDLKRGSIGEVFGPEVIACGLRAGAKGHLIGKPVGDPWQMPGLFLVQGPDVLWSHDFAHIGDHPDFTVMPQLVADLSAPAP